MNRGIERVLIGVNLAMVGIVAVVLASEGSPLRRQVDEWQSERRMRRQLAANWNDLVAVGGRLDSANGVVRLVEFSDYECPFCLRASPSVDSVALLHGVGVVYRHYPLDNHKAAPGAARASICAEAQGRFREMHARLFATNQWQSDTNWVREAGAAGVPDAARFRECLASPATHARLAEDVRLGNALGVDGTPSFFGAGSAVRGAVAAADLLTLAGLNR